MILDKEAAWSEADQMAEPISAALETVRRWALGDGQYGGILSFAPLQPLHATSLQWRGG